MAEPTPAPERAALDPTRKNATEAVQPEKVVRDVTAGRAAGTEWNAAQDPTRPATPVDPRR
jgi:hypothetical protein